MPATPLELIAVEVRADIGQLERGMTGAVRVVDRNMGDLERSVVSAERSVVRSAGAMSNAQRNLGRQFADVGASLASGSSPFVILAQQAPQVADALADTGGRAARVAAFFAGPWGAALLAAASVMGVLASEMLSSGEAADAHEKSAKSLAAAIRDMTEATKGAIQTSQQAEQQHYNEAGALLVKAQNARKATVALLEQARSRLETDESRAVGGRAANYGANFVAQNSERDVARLNKQIATQNALIKEQGENVRRAGVPLLQRQAAEATDKATAATGKYDRALGSLNTRFEAGKITPAAYRSELEKLNRTRDVEVAAAGKSERATKGDAAAKREAAKAARELEKAQRELEQSLRSVTAAFDPAKAAAVAFRETLRDIDKLRAAGLLSDMDALSYKLIAARDQAKAVADQFAKDSEAGFLSVGFTPGDLDGTNLQNQINRDLELKEAANQAIAEDFARKQEAQIRNLAGVYETLFQEGTDGIWRDFKAIGLRIIAETLARFTIAKLSGQGGSVLDFAKTATSAVLGFAGGGSGVFGGKGGTDKNVLSLNGAPIANVSRGETFAVGTRANAGRGGQTIINAPQFNLAGAVVTRELYADMERISSQSAARAGAASYAQSQQSTPGTLNKYTQLKG